MYRPYTGYFKYFELCFLRHIEMVIAEKIGIQAYFEMMTYARPLRELNRCCFGRVRHLRLDYTTGERLHGFFQLTNPPLQLLQVTISRFIKTHFLKTVGLPA